MDEEEVIKKGEEVETVFETDKPRIGYVAEDVDVLKEEEIKETKYEPLHTELWEQAVKEIKLLLKASPVRDRYKAFVNNGTFRKGEFPILED